MKKDEVVQGVQGLAIWWIEERLKKVRSAKHDTMEVNPFMAPLIAAIHGHSNFLELAEFLIGGHFAIGHATGFGKLIDEKILPKVFNTTKLDKAIRGRGVLKKSCFDNIDHIVKINGKDVLLSLKASKWTIQLGQAVELNKSFAEIQSLLAKKEHHYEKIVIATFYGKAENLTDKYKIVRGINTGANHDVYDITSYVSVLAGKEFWTWVGDHEETQKWVIEGIVSATESKRNDLKQAQQMMTEFKESFAKNYEIFKRVDGTIDWETLLEAAN